MPQEYGHLFKPIHHCPTRTIFLRIGDFSHNKISARRGWLNASRCVPSFLPRIALNQFTPAVVDMNGNAGVIGVGSHAEPIVIPFEEGVRDGFHFFDPEIPSPLIISNNVTLL